MTSERRLPPSGRDFEAYVRVVVEQGSTREVARELAISQTRVCQVVARVAEYVQQVAPAATSAEDRGRQAYVAQQIAAEQLRFYQREAFEGFQRSIGRQTVVREVEINDKPKGSIQTTKVSHGDVRLLDRATKYALLGAKLPAPNLAGLMPEESEEALAEADRAAALEIAAEEAEEKEWLDSQVSEDSRLQQRDESYVSPPIEDCSAAKAKSVGKDHANDFPDDSTPPSDTTSKSPTEDKAAANRAEIRARRSVQLRQQLVKIGVREEEMDEFLSSDTGREVVRGFEAIFS